MLGRKLLWRTAEGAVGQEGYRAGPTSRLVVSTWSTSWLSPFTSAPEVSRSILVYNWYFYLVILELSSCNCTYSIAIDISLN